MALISVEEAQRFYGGLPDRMRYAHFSPAYILADAERDEGLEPRFFLHKEDGGFFYHAFHLGRVPGTDFFDVQSPYGYGGVLLEAEDASFPARAWARYREWCRDTRVLAEFIRFHPGLKNERAYDGEVIFDRQTVWINPMASEDPFAGYNAKTRTAVRKAVKTGLRAVLYSPEEFCEHFVPLYYETMRNAGAKDFYLFGDRYFRAMASTPSARLIIFREERPVAGAIYLLGGENMESHLTASNQEGRETRAGHLIIHEMKRISAERGCRYLNLGGGTDSAPDNALLSFKKNFSSALDDFYIGKCIVFQKEYEVLRSEWVAKTGNQATVILFYR